MINFKTLALTTLAALSAVAPVEAAVNHKGVTFHEPSDFSGHHSVLVKQLYQVGVAVVDGRGTNGCPEGVAGWYSGEDNLMVICGGSHAFRSETLTHEAVHVVQDCRAGLNNATLSGPSEKFFRQLASGLAQSKVDLIVNQYDKSKWARETEAFYFETRPEMVRAAMTNVCGASWSF